MRRSPSLVPLTLAIALLYFASAKLGLSMAFAAEQVSAVWPPTGIALAAVVLLGRRVWPGIALGAFFANVTAHEPLATACGIAAGNTLEALAGAAVLARFGMTPRLERSRDVLALVVAALASPVASATIGVVSLCLGGVQPWSAFGSLWLVWWIGDAIGDLVTAPVVMVWASAPRFRIGGRRLVEAVALVGATTAICFLAFAARVGTPVSGYPLHYTIFPFVIWAALRLRQHGTTAIVFVMSSVAIWGTLNGWGPFAMTTTNESLVLLQLFIAVVAVTALLLGAAISERDLAERRAAVDFAALQFGEERLRLALAAGRMGVWDWNIATGEVTWPETLEPIHGLAAGTFAGTFEAFRNLVHPDHRDLVDRALSTAVRDGTGYDLEFRTVWPDRTTHWMSAKGRVLCDAAGRSIRMLGVGADVTERRQLEEALRERARELVDADRRKDEFLAMLAHELRNPLAPLSTALHLLAVDPSARERALGIANRQVKQLVRLVDDLLDVSRITKGKVVLQKSRVALADVVTRAVETARPLIDARGHASTTTLPTEAVELDADPARLAQVLANLLGNAAEYTPPGGAIALGVERTPGGVVMRVRDTGIGLAPELLPHVFDLFVQGDASLDRAHGGLGIGLTIVRRLVEMHGGRVEATSAGVGHGSEFSVHLPVVPSRVGSADAIASRDGNAAAGRLAVLVVEDNEDSAEALAAVLRLWGHDVRVAFDGLAALETAKTFRPDVVLSDVGLPGMDGYELARRLRADPALRETLLVALSGYGRDEDRERARDAGFDRHLVKPPDLDALARLLAADRAAP